MSDNNGDSYDRRKEAKRAFLSEVLQTKHTEKEGDGQFDPVKAFLPSGEKTSRVVVMGTVTDIETINDNIYKLNMTDTSTTMTVSVGEWSQQPYQKVMSLEVPVRVCLVGKIRTDESDDEDDDTVYTNLNPEALSVVDRPTQQRWIMETAKDTLNRLESETEPEVSETLEGVYGTQEDYEDARAAVRDGVVEVLEHLDQEMN